ncbi:esterase-like activity of phytase family protein [Erythrobacter oryzae]|uniref:esterase-like activity of phytase family protein n=1 Tax=Erythrobacter oryzae TaxID=3019556 RepID=UPI0025534F22|nr:esterase-like activity of phytase family protein [Erythrobacter sp. COR-2]
MTAKAPRGRRWRLALIAGVVLALAPGTFLRTPIGTRTDRAEVTVTPRPERTGVSGELQLTGVWELTSPHGWFGGFSALAAGEGQALVAGTDRGFLLDLDLAGPAPRAVPGSYRFVGITNRKREEIVDLESLARDPATGTLWTGFEGENLVMRLAPGAPRREWIPPAMKEWSYNSGPEAMTRLAGGRFLVIAEGARRDNDALHQALLFPGDPLEGNAPIAFDFAPPAGFDPVDATQLPDGRVLILLRRVAYTIPAATFDTAIAIADPAEIRAGATWRGRVIERMEGGIFADNFEGIAFVASADDPKRGAVWLITDDNFSVFQRSLLIRLGWPGEAPTKPAP